MECKCDATEEENIERTIPKDEERVSMMPCPLEIEGRDGENEQMCRYNTARMMQVAEDEQRK